MTEGQARRILRAAAALGLTTAMPSTAGRPDVTGWQAQDGTHCVTFWREPLETCPAVADAERRLEYERRRAAGRVA